MMQAMKPHLARARRVVLTALCLLAVPLAQSRPALLALAPGEYVNAGGTGVLTLRTETAEADRRLLFELETVGGNGHTCSLDGEIRNGRTTVSGTPEPAACVVRFVATGYAIDVSTNDAESCRSFCGVRASFVGRYLRPAPGCDSLSRGATGADFKRLYDSGAYRDAQQLAGRLLERCAGTMDRIERGRLLNDLAISQYRLGLFEACLRTLQPLAEDAAPSQAALQDGLPPVDDDNYLPVIESTRSNLRLCKGSEGRP
jgi:hypothetical protein